MGSKLSGGQKQRLALARTFYNNSQVIILDEPTSALDSTTELNIVKRLREISKNKIIIFFTHNENLKRYFNEVYIIKNQKIKNMKIILVTGAAGFIGFHVSKDLLKRNFKVIGLDNMNNYYSVKLKKNA